eukprot:g7495.t1
MRAEGAPVAIAIPDYARNEQLRAEHMGSLHAGGLHDERMYMYGGEDDATCAFIGFLFSCNPLIGWLTFWFNAGAPPGSRRRFFGVVAGAMAAVTVLQMMLFPERYNHMRNGNAFWNPNPRTKPAALRGNATHG